MNSSVWSRASTVAFGLLLIFGGAILLAVNTFGMQLPFDLGRLGWPAFVIVPGLALLVIGLITRSEAGIGLSVAGGIITAVGLLLWYQESTKHWSSWAYAWALVAPFSVGAAMFLWGLFHRRGDVIRQGLSGLGVGTMLFVVGFAFFEGVLNIGGDRGLAPLGRQALPIALIGAGVLIIISRFWPRRRPQPAWQDWSQVPPPTPTPPPWEPPPTPPFEPAATPQPAAALPPESTEAGTETTERTA